MLECAIHPITYRGEGILATVVKVNTTTVYRYLDKLCAEHVVIKYPDLNSDKAVFQFAGEEKKCTDHLHLKCIRCGKVVHLDCDFMDELKEHLFQASFCGSDGHCRIRFPYQKPRLQAVLRKPADCDPSYSPENRFFCLFRRQYLSA